MWRRNNKIAKKKNYLQDTRAQKHFLVEHVHNFSIEKSASRQNGNDKNDIVDDEPRKNRLSKDLEGMYAKVMKKNKLSNAPSQNTSPVPSRKTLPNDAQQMEALTHGIDWFISTIAT